jgi:hypothetical protein
MAIEAAPTHAPSPARPGPKETQESCALVRGKVAGDSREAVYCGAFHFAAEIDKLVRGFGEFLLVMGGSCEQFQNLCSFCADASPLGSEITPGTVAHMASDLRQILAGEARGR